MEPDWVPTTHFSSPSSFEMNSQQKTACRFWPANKPRFTFRREPSSVQTPKDDEAPYTIVVESLENVMSRILSLPVDAVATKPWFAPSPKICKVCWSSWEAAARYFPSCEKARAEQPLCKSEKPWTPE